MSPVLVVVVVVVVVVVAAAVVMSEKSCVSFLLFPFQKQLKQQKKKNRMKT